MLYVYQIISLEFRLSLAHILGQAGVLVTAEAPQKEERGCGGRFTPPDALKRGRSAGFLRQGYKLIAQHALHLLGQAGQPAPHLVVVVQRLEHGQSLARRQTVMLQLWKLKFVPINHLAIVQIFLVGWTKLVHLAPCTRVTLGAQPLVDLVPKPHLKALLSEHVRME